MASPLCCRSTRRRRRRPIRTAGRRRWAQSAAGFDGTPAVQPQIPVYLVFDNQKYRIDREQFIIGRGTKFSDLPIKDGNISRKHAAVIRRNGTFFIKDLGSTNGIDFKGMRIDNKRIDEGDIFHLCEYGFASPSNDSALDAPITSLPGAGPVTAGRLGERGVRTARDLLMRLPRGYSDLRRATPLASLLKLADGTVVLVRGRSCGCMSFHAGSSTSSSGRGRA